MRTEKSIKNILVALVSYVTTLIIGFLARSFFLKILGSEYLGINSLFGNIISILSVVELGFGSAIIYNLYKPLSEKNIEAVKSLMNFYKYVYRVIAIVVLGIGSVIVPFIPKIVGRTSVCDNLYILFFLFVIDATTSYMLSYKRSIFYADQRNYVVNLVHAVLYLFINIIQIATLYIYKSFYLFLIIQIAFHIVENVTISILANKKYAYLTVKGDVKKIDAKVRKDIIQKVKGLLFHQVGSAIVLGTDNIIISMTKTLGVVMVGKYSNYVMIINNLNSLTSQVFSSVTASVGNLLVEKDSNDSYVVYKRILFLNAFLLNFMCVSLFCIMEPFICIWVGNEYVLPLGVLTVVTVNFYVQGMKRTCGIFKNAAGIFYEDRYVPLMESLLNLFFSILLVNYFGLVGVCLGTIISSIVHWFYDFPKYVYSKIFEKKASQYILDYLPFIVVFIISILCTYMCSCVILLRLNSNILKVIVSMVICLLVPNLIFVLCFLKANETKYWISWMVCKLGRKTL